ncbi:hypothetical protein SAMN05443252_103494 [Bacillus sp. OV322]|nr:hypothetical protein SAMN05443252_103494 [Bacillus sp. OV322]
MNNTNSKQEEMKKNQQEKNSQKGYGDKKLNGPDRPST